MFNLITRGLFRLLRRSAPRNDRWWWYIPRNDMSLRPRAKSRGKQSLFVLLFLLLTIDYGLAYAGQLLFDGVPVDITTAANEDLVIAPGTGGNTQIGDATGTNTNATSNDDLHITGILETDGAAYLNSATTLGDSTSDTITLTGYLGSHLIPATDSTYTLGSSTSAWNYIYADIISGYNAALALNPATGYSLTGSVTKNAAAGNEVAYNLAATINKTAGNYTGLQLNVTETSAPGAADLLLDLQVGAASMFSVNNAGNVVAAGTITGAGFDLNGTTSPTFTIDQNTPGLGNPATLTLKGAAAGYGKIATTNGRLLLDAASGTLQIDDTTIDLSTQNVAVTLHAAAVNDGINFDSNTFVIDANQNRVGIGTATPEQILHVSSAADIVVQIDSQATSRKSQIYFDRGAGAGTWFGPSATDTLDLWSQENIPFVLALNNSQVFTILANGSVGINQTNPTSILHTVASGAKTADYIGNRLTATATSSTAAVTKTGLSVESTGTWDGLTAVNRGLYITATGGTTNYSAYFTGSPVMITNTAPFPAQATGAGELYVQNDLEVGGTIYGATAITGTTSNDFKIGSGSGASSTDISLTFGKTGDSETITFTGAGTDNFAFSDLIETDGLTVTANNNLTMSSGTGLYSQTYTGTATDAFQIIADSLTTADAIEVSANALISGTVLNITSTSTAADAYKLINLASSGAAAASKDRYGIYSSLTGTGTGTNFSGYFSATGASSNYAVYAVAPGTGDKGTIYSECTGDTGTAGVFKATASGVGSSAKALYVQNAGDSDVAVYIENTNATNPTQTLYCLQNGAGYSASFIRDLAASSGSILTVAELKHTVTGAAGANGIGAGLVFTDETATGGTEHAAGRISGVLTTAAAATSAGDLIFESAAANALTEYMRIYSAGNVRVGNTGTPASATGAGDLYVNSDLEVGGILYAGSTSATGTTSPTFEINSAGSSATLTTASLTGDRIFTFPDTALTFAGINVAQTFTADQIIGGTTPQLTIGDAGAEDTALVFDGNAQDYIIGLDDTDDSLQIGTGSGLPMTAGLYMDTSGKAGFGATTPRGRVHIANDGDQLIIDELPHVTDPNDNIWVFKADGGQFNLLTADDDWSSWSSVFTIDRTNTTPDSINFSTTTVGIGDDTPDAKLDIDNAAATVDSFGINHTSTTNGADAEQIAITQSNGTLATATNAGITISATSSSILASTLLGINIANITGGAATENAISIGTGWDAALTVGGTTVLNSTGQLAAGTQLTGLVPLANGGTNANLTASNGGIFYSTASAGAILSGTATANQVLLSGLSTTPAWSTATYPATTTVSQILYSSATNTIAGLATANSGVLVTSGTGVPSISSTLPAFTAGGTIDMNTTNIITNIGNTNTDFDITGGLTLASDLNFWGGKRAYFYDDSGVTQRGFVGKNRTGNDDLTLISKTNGSWFRIGANASNIAFWMDGNADVNDLPQIIMDSNGDLTLAPYTASAASLVMKNTVSNASDKVIDVTPAFTGGATDALTYTVVDVAAFTANNPTGTDTVNAISVGNLTETVPATITSTALKIGTGWDAALTVGGTTVINGSGAIGAVGSAITGTTSTTFEIDSDAAAGLILDATGLATSDKTFTFPNVTSKVLTNNMSDATVAVTLNGAVDALNFDSDTLSIDASSNRVGIGTAAPTHALIVGSGTLSSINPNTKIIATDATDARLGAAVSNKGAFVSAGDAATYGGVFAYDYGTPAALHLALNQYGGNVGIGDVSPDAELDVEGTAPTLYLTDSTASAKSLAIDVDANIADLREVSGASGSLMTLDLANAVVGIGTASPSTTNALTLQRNGATLRLQDPNNGGHNYMEWYSNGAAQARTAYFGYGFDASTDFTLATTRGGSSDIVLDPENGVGIDLSGPLAKLAVFGGIAANYTDVLFPNLRGAINHYGNSGGLTIAAQGANNSTAGSGDITFQNPETNSADASTDAALTTHMVIKYDGKVGIGDTTPDSELDIESTAPTLYLTDSTASAKSLAIDVDANIADLREVSGASGSLMTLDLSNNRVGIGTNSPNTALQIGQDATSNGSIQISADNVEGYWDTEANPRWKINRDIGGNDKPGIGFGPGGATSITTMIYYSAPYIFRTSAYELQRDSDDSALKLVGGTTNTSAASLELYGPSNTGNQGRFRILLGENDGGSKVGVGMDIMESSTWATLMQMDTNGAAIFNYNHNNNADFYVKGDTDGDYTFYVDTSADSVGIGNNGPTDKLHVTGAIFATTGVHIGADADANLISTASTGAGSTALYIGNKQITAAFTEFHNYLLGDKDLKPGELVYLGDDHRIYRATEAKDPRVIGIYYGKTAHRDAWGNDIIYQKDGKDYVAATDRPAASEDYPRLVAIIGDSWETDKNDPVKLEGAWVCDEGGPVKNGDLLCSSSRPGFLMKQVDDLLHSYTVAKARETVQFDENGAAKNTYVYLLQ